jgi:phage tail sheath protein FI
MPEYLAPGVFIEEVEMGPKPIEGVSTTTTGFLGETERGPVRPRLMTSWAQYLKLYGEYTEGSFLPYAVKGFFDNGGRRCFIARIAGQGTKTAAIEIPADAGPNIPSTPATSTSDAAEGGEASDSSTPAPSTTRRRSRSPQESSSGPAMEIRAIGPGAWGNRVSVKIGAAKSDKRIPGLFMMTVSYTCDNVSDATSGAAIIMEEVHDGLSMNPASSNYVEKKINAASNLVNVSKVGDAPPIKDDQPKLLSGGTDASSINRSDYTGTGGGGSQESSGLAAFEQIDDISIVCCPNEHRRGLDGLTGELVTHCENMKDRFAILQSEQGIGDKVADIELPDSKNVAFYHPWIEVIDPLSNSRTFNSAILVPPCGHIAGIYARTDNTRGVHKAPANETILSIQGLERKITRGEQERLNPSGVNCIRLFRGRGIRVWGARTTSSDPLWKYINVRRLFLYIAESIEEGTQWVVFEPNSERLWPRVRQTVSQFLTGVWRGGALMGVTPAEAFFVKCDRSTMTQDDIDNGRLIIEIGFAPVKPAEFVIFRIAQWSGGAKVSE